MTTTSTSHSRRPFRCFRSLTLSTTAATLLGFVQFSQAAIESRDILKTYFETGDVPTQQQFADVIDSYVHKLDDGVSVYKLQAVLAGVDGGAALLTSGTPVGPGQPFTDVTGLSSDWTGQSGFLGLSFLINSELHYGYVDISSLGTTPGNPYPFFAAHFVYETDAGAPIVAQAVPEPATLTLAALGGLALVGAAYRRRRQTATAG